MTNPLFTQINAILDQLGEGASVDEVEYALRDYGKREILVVVADRGLAAGGEGGGSLPEEWTVTDGALLMEPTDPTDVPLRIELPVGAAGEGGDALQVWGETGVHQPVNVSTYGVLTLRADVIDDSNGGGSLVLRNAAGTVKHRLEADNGSGAARAGFFGANLTTQPVAPESAQDIADALGSLGLVAPGGTVGGGSLPEGSYLPTAIPDDVTVDDETYTSPIGSGTLTTLVFPASAGALAFAIEGDDYPRVVFGSDPTDAFLYLSDGTYDPSSGAAIYLQGDTLVVQGKGAGGLDTPGSFNASSLGPRPHYVTVIHAPPDPASTYVTPLLFDDTGTTGGVWAWTGAVYQQVTVNGSV